jgi:UDP-N-acetylglucosamine enolpyruvyl transferase
MSVEMLLIPIVIAAVGTAGTGVSIFSSNKEISKDKNIMVYETKMKDKELLKNALEVFGHKPFLEENLIDIDLDEYNLIFQLNEQNIFEAVFQGDITEEQAQVMVSNIYDEYTKLVQERVYYKVLENIKDYDIDLESESVHDDNSIVLTLNIREEIE